MAEQSKRFSMGPVAFLVAGLAFMENLDGAILPTAAPTIARNFHILSSQIGICITAYIVAIVCFIPVSAWLVGKFGVRPVLFASIAIFVLGSVLCAISTSLTELTIMRVLQGVGASAMVPVGRLIVFQSTNKNEIVRAISYLVWPALTAPVVAPIIGGFIVTNYSWHWIFLVNLPVGLIALLVAYKIVPHIPGTPGSGLDWLGFWGSSIALSALILGAAQIGAAKVNVTLTISMFLIGVGAAVPTVRHLLRDRMPLVDLAPLRIHTFRAANGTGALYRIAHSFAPFLLPLLFQDGFHWSPSRSGEILFFYMAGNLGFKPATNPLIRRFRYKPLLLTTTTLSIVATVGLVLMSSTTPIFLIAILLIVMGSVRSMGMTLYASMTFADIDPDQLTHANTLYSIIGQITGILGVALAVIALKVGESFFSASQGFPAAFVIAGIFLALSYYGLGKLPASAGESLRK